MQLAHEPNTEPSKCKVMPEEWGVSKLAPAQVEGPGGALFQECLAQKVIPGVKIHENFINIFWILTRFMWKKEKERPGILKNKRSIGASISPFEKHTLKYT